MHGRDTLTIFTTLSLLLSFPTSLSLSDGLVSNAAKARYLYVYSMGGNESLWSHKEHNQPHHSPCLTIWMLIKRQPDFSSVPKLSCPVFKHSKLSLILVSITSFKLFDRNMTDYINKLLEHPKSSRAGERWLNCTHSKAWVSVKHSAFTIKKKNKSNRAEVNQQTT